MIYKDSAGNRVETHDDKADPVKFFDQGGGFEQTLPRIKFHARHTLETTPPAWHPGTVTAEWLEGKSYPCYSNGNVWNGWGMPAFTPGTINILIVDLAAAGATGKVEWVGDQLMYTDPDEDEAYEVVPIIHNSRLLYPLGAGHWTWDQIVFDNPLSDLTREFAAAMQRDYPLFPLVLGPSGGYISAGTQHMWNGFKLARKALT